eukprot:TRINITY_DN6921_c0_g1_i9.p2 TRINITY_DN6921_c0_g1~~TRINITY_DN6921_c0_g1_i9.p2  ORF type:complete len:106 (+),score=0.11 TRINITY_DN6921_c0_g1_i9:190-507(+)
MNSSLPTNCQQAITQNKTFLQNNIITKQILFPQIYEQLITYQLLISNNTKQTNSPQKQSIRKPKKPYWKRIYAITKVHKTQKKNISNKIIKIILRLNKENKVQNE